MNSKLSRWCDGLIEAGWLAAIIAIPLFFNIHSDRVFEPDKLTLLRSIALVMSAAWIIKFIDQNGWEDLNWLHPRSENSIWRMPFALPVFLLVLIYLISSIFSVSPTISLLGSYQRLQGTYSTFAYIVVFALMAATIRTRAQASRVATAVIITSIPISFYGLLQHFDLDPLPWGGNTVTRIAGHMGNAIFVAAYLIMAVPLTLARIIDAFTSILNDEELAYADVIRSSIYIFTLAIQFIAIFWTQSRGPLVGLAAGLFAFVLIVLVSLRQADPEKKRFGLTDILKAVALVFVGGTAVFVLISQSVRILTNAGQLQSLDAAMGSFAAFVGAVGLLILVIFVMIAMRRGWRWLWLSWMLLALVGIIWVGAFNFTDELNEQFSDSPVLGGAVETLSSWTELPSIGRLGRMLESDASTGRVRVLIWEGTLELIAPHEPLEFPDGKEDGFNFLRPLIGYGPESMYVAYNRFYPPELATVEARNASPDRAHNETFDALVITGWIGFIVWQILYISVFYYGFRWLGVIRSRRDTYLMIGLWIGVAIVVALAMVQAMGMEFLGVGIPFGSMFGLVLYLIYYALSARADEDGGDPFDVDRLIMIGLVTAVLAHYAEIHFGIAIAASRVHFFAYVGLMFAMGYVLPKLKAEPAVGEPVRKRKRRGAGSARTGVWGPAFIHTLILGLIVGILGYEFMTYSLPPDKVIQSAADLTTWDIFYQSLLVNSRQEFSPSPFIFVMIILTWMLGALVSLSEMAKTGEIKFTAVSGKQPPQRQQIAGIVLVVVGVVALILRFLPASDRALTSTVLLGQSMLLIWSALSLWAGIQLLIKRESAPLSAGAVALTGFLFALPGLIAGGGWIVLIFALASVAVLFLLWDDSWNRILLPAGIMGFLSLALGLSYAYLHAWLLRSTILFSAPATAQALSQTELRVLEAGASTTLLTTFYLFVFGIIFAGAFVLSASGGGRVKRSGSLPAYVSLAILSILVLFGISQTNLRVIHADIVYKRGKPFDSRREWDTAIAIYEEALKLAPNEDFYELFLGRALLEAATAAEGIEEQKELLEKADSRLIRAQDVNPLNTDHTANLARLNTRWLQLEQDQDARVKRLDNAEAYYKAALELSPQNSIIRNEYARLSYDLKKDCELALALYNQSVEIDPYYDVSFLGMADTYIACAADLPADEQNEYYEEATAALDAGLALKPRNARAWLQLGQLEQQLGNHEAALDAFEEALAQDTNTQLQTWQVEYFTAVSHQELGNDIQAEEFARRALITAPENVRPQIQQFITNLTGVAPQPPQEPVIVDAPEGERPLATIPPAGRNNFFDEYPEMVIDLDKQYEAVITTDNGQMRLKLFPQEAPLTVNSFVFLANQGFFDGVTFHRVLDGFMAQGGDPSGSGAGGPGYQFVSETDNDLAFDRPGILAMANAGPDTNGSQFFITFEPTPQLNGGYTIFGELTAGDDVLNAITRRNPQSNPDFPGDTIQFIEIIEK